MSITIRNARESDLEDVKEVLATTWHHTYDSIFGIEEVTRLTNAWHSIDALKQNLNAPCGSFLVAEQDSKITATSFSTYCPKTKKIKLCRLYILPSMQGLGLGKNFLAQIYKQFPMATAIQLEVEPKNTSAIKFYEKQGFQITGEGQDCGGQGDNIIHFIMEKEL